VQERREVLRRFIAVAFASVLAVAMMAPAALAEETECRGAIGATTVDNLKVPQGASCTLNGTKVKGTITVESEAKLYAKGVRVIGSIQSDGFQTIIVRERFEVDGSVQRSKVGGNVQLKNGLSGGIGRVMATRINGDLQFEANEAQIVARKNAIFRNLQVVQNTGGVEILGNTIAENLQCKENNPPPTGRGNKAGDKEDQCAAL
jgi:hypothetical protein